MKIYVRHKIGETMNIDCLQRFNRFLKDILIPASEEFNIKLDSNKLILPDAFSMTFFLAHSLDHISACTNRLKLLGQKRPERVKAFDELFQVEGSRFQNHKFRIVDAVNNSIKHVYLNERAEYRDLKSEYGLVDFQVLKEKDGTILYDKPGYRFDYCRVVLRPILKVLTTGYISEYDAPEGCDLAYGFIESVESSIKDDGRINCVPICDSPLYDEFDPTTAIDRMVEYYKPTCLDCGELEEDCQCDSFLYDDKAGAFDPDVDLFFDFEGTFAQISGAGE